MNIEEVDAMPAAAFAAAFGEVAEHSPWVAERAAGRRPFASREAMIEAFAAVLAAASADEKLALVRAHPDLAGKAAVAGTLTDDSRREQAGAGLASLSPEEFARFTRLNAAYRERFGFPFVFAVKGAGKDQILAAFEERLGNDRERELSTALAHVARIVRFRIEARIEP